MEAPIYNHIGEAQGKITLPEKVFGVRWNGDLVHQVVTVMQANKRAGTAHSKNRGEVRGGGKKPWRQKGTGQARHGSIRSPLWKGGGATFGPRSDKKYGRLVSRSMKARALAVVLSEKYRNGEVAFVKDLPLKEAKTKEALAAMRGFSRIEAFKELAGKKKNALLLALPARDEKVEKSFRNFSNVLVEEVRNVNPVELLTCRYVIFVEPERSLEMLAKRVS